MGNGSLIMLSLGLTLLLLYLNIFGFSSDVIVRWGQYASLVVVGFCIMEEIFRER
jgi:hypothetical protein